MRIFRSASLAALVVLIACSSSSSSSDNNPADGGGDDAGPGDDTGGDDAGGKDAAKPPNPDVKSTTESFDFNGTQRKYLLSVPVDYDATKKYPLVMEFHGNPGTAEGMLAYYPFDAASKRGAIVAYPNAAGTDWDLFTAEPNADMDFVKALRDALVAKWSIDPNRVFGFGWSGGAFFVNQMACRFSGVFRAISSQSGGAPLDVTPGDESTYSKCTGGPMAIFIVHGTADTTVDYGSGVSDRIVWSKINGCQDSQSATAPNPCVKEDGCPAASPVVFCGIEGGSHAPWIETIPASWDFFQSFQ